MENCIARQKKTIDSEFNIGEVNIQFSQRLLTKKEVDVLESKVYNVAEDETIFTAMLSAERLDEGEEIPADVVFQMAQAKKHATDLKYNNDIYTIAKSLTPNIVYGGMFKIDGEIVNNDDIIDKLNEILDVEMFDLLLANVIKLAKPTEVEVTEAK